MRKIILIIVFAFLIIAGYVSYQHYKYILPFLNTLYANDFNEEKFNAKLIGLKESELKEILGEPLRITKTNKYVCFLYTNQPEKIDIAEGFIGVIFINDTDSLSESKIKYNLRIFDSIGNPISEMSSNPSIVYALYNEDYNVFNQKDVLRLFGKPQKKKTCNCDFKVYVYSQYKWVENDMNKINVRLVYLDNTNKVVGIYKNINFDGAYNLGLCKYENDVF